jgi:hypothetical protein
VRKTVSQAFVLILVAVLLSACGGSRYSYRQDSYEASVEPGAVLRAFELDESLEGEILALDAEHVSDQDVQEVLARAPAPRIINIHGGIYPVHLAMKSFSRFLIGMGYPEARIRDPRDGSYSHSCYESSEKFAGYIAWYYEREGLRPMMVGHSQGGIQAVKVLHELAGTFGERVAVWNPLSGSSEERYSIVDPLLGVERPVVGLQVSYASAVGSGGLTRFLPNQWIMAGRLRRIPDSVIEFTGYSIGLDVLGGDLMGFGSSNKYAANGKASVRNVKLPSTYSHVTVPTTKHLAESEEIRDWINNYTPSEEPEIDREFGASSANILWAADVWYSVKKHWVLELQNLVLARRAMRRER